MEKQYISVSAICSKLLINTCGKYKAYAGTSALTPFLPFYFLFVPALRCLFVMARIIAVNSKLEINSIPKK